MSNPAPRPPHDAPPVRLGAVSYLNTLPLTEGLDACAGLDLTLAAPSHLADMLARGDVDLAIVPVIDALRHPGFELVPAGAIGCTGATLSVRLYSTEPFDRVSTVHADVDSHTSVALATWILRQRFGTAPEFVPFDARERVETTGKGVEWPPAMLMIGDKVVTDSPPAVRYPHQLDLGQAWHELTGLPFVYAVWMRRADSERTEATDAAVALLDRQRRLNATRLDWIASARAPERRWPADLAREYLGERLCFCIGAEQREAIERFFRAAAEVGAAEFAPPRWSDEPCPA